MEIHVIPILSKKHINRGNKIVWMKRMMIHFELISKICIAYKKWTFNSQGSKKYIDIIILYRKYEKIKMIEYKVDIRVSFQLKKIGFI